MLNFVNKCDNLSLLAKQSVINESKKKQNHRYFSRCRKKIFVDLLIVDPPYNLAKNFHGNKFKKTSDEVYAEYTEQWLLAVLPHLKDNASIYVCCDWQSSIVIADILKKYLHVS